MCVCAFIYLDKIKNAKKLSMQVQQEKIKKVRGCCEEV